MVLGFRKDAERLKEMESSLKESFRLTRDELDDHRESINQNTNEIQTNYEYLCKLESKLNKITERLDELSMFFKQLNGQEKRKFTVSQLTRKEQEVFLVIYMNEGVTVKDLSRRLAITPELGESYLGNLITKGIPIIRKRIAGTVELIEIDSEFKAIQAKENILRINETISQSVQN